MHFASMRQEIWHVVHVSMLLCIRTISKALRVWFLFLLYSLFWCFALHGSDPFYFGNCRQIMARVRFFFPALQLDFPGMAIEYRFNAVPFFQLQSMQGLPHLAPCPYVMSDWFLWVFRVIF